MRLRGMMLCGMLTGFLAGCAGESLAFVSSTKLGLSVSAGRDAPAEAQIGYHRFEGASVPVSREDGNAKAPPVLAVMDISNEFFGPLRIRHVFATGRAAEARGAAFVDDTLLRERPAAEPQEGSGRPGRCGGQ